MNNIKNTWKGIRNLISWKQSASPYIHLLSQDNETVSNPKKIVNIFNDYFSTIAEKTKAKVRFSNKSFDEFLQHPNKNSSFLRPTSSDEITNLILSLYEGKSVGPNGLPTKILKRRVISLCSWLIYLIFLFPQESFLLDLKFLKLFLFIKRTKIKMLKL